MKKNLLFAGLIYAIATVALLVYLGVVASEGAEEIEEIGISIFYVAGSTFLCFGLAFLSYLIYFLKQTKLLEDSAYANYLGMGIRVQLGLLVSAILGIALSLALVYCLSQDYIGVLEIVIPVIVFVAVNMVCFITLKPRP